MKKFLCGIVVLVGLCSSARSFAKVSNGASGNSGLAVVLIDMQLGFYKRGGAEGTAKLNSLVLNQMKLLNWARGNLIPVIVLQYSGFGETDPKLMSIIKKGRYRVIQKNTDGGFEAYTAADIVEALREWKVDSLIIAGINGPYCVKSTIEGALARGYDVMTTHYVIGNLNEKPPIYPNGVWSFKHARLTVFPTLESIIR